MNLNVPPVSFLHSSTVCGSIHDHYFRLLRTAVHCYPLSIISQINASSTSTLCRTPLGSNVAFTGSVYAVVPSASTLCRTPLGSNVAFTCSVYAAGPSAGPLRAHTEQRRASARGGEALIVRVEYNILWALAALYLEWYLVPLRE